MGHGASTKNTVKRFTVSQELSEGNGGTTRHRSRQSSARQTQADGDAPIQSAPSPVRPGWTRSSSDGCIVENLNTSKTKTEFLEQQLDEYKELFRHAEERAEEAQTRAKRLEEQLAEVEGTNFELLDRVSDIEQQLEGAKDQMPPDAEREFSQMLMERDQLIEKQEEQVKSLEEELAKMRLKLRKKLRSVQTELAEAKQESGLKMYSLKEQIGSLQEENARLLERLDRAHSSSVTQSRQSSAANARAMPSGSLVTRDAQPEEEDWEDGRTRVILELSGQLSGQEERISELEAAIREKDKSIEALQQQQSRTHPRPPSGSHRTKGSAGSRSRSAEKQGQPDQADRSDSLTGEGDSAGPGSVMRPKRPSSKRNGSAGSQRSTDRDPATNGPADDRSDDEAEADRRIGSAGGGNEQSRPRRHSARSVDSAISDRSASDAGPTNPSSAGSSRERRRLRKQSSAWRSASTDRNGGEREELAKTLPDVEGRDSGIGVSTDPKSKYTKDIDHLLNDIFGDDS